MKHISQNTFVGMGELGQFRMPVTMHRTYCYKVVNVQEIDNGPAPGTAEWNGLMQQYPKIDGSSRAPLGVPCIAFYKYDGSNLRWEWSPKQGWHKFGTRKHLFDASDPVYGKAIPIFMTRMADEIVRRVKDLERGVQRITVFTEYFGPNSFAGQHVETDSMQLKLIDAFLYKRGFMNPKVFVQTFGDMPDAAQVIYSGNLNQEFIADVRAGKYPVYEGVVVKGDWGMVKIKTQAYFKRLNEVYGSAWRQHWE